MCVLLETENKSRKRSDYLTNLGEKCHISKRICVTLNHRREFSICTCMSLGFLSNLSASNYFWWLPPVLHNTDTKKVTQHGIQTNFNDPSNLQPIFCSLLSQRTHFSSQTMWSSPLPWATRHKWKYELIRTRQIMEVMIRWKQSLVPVDKTVAKKPCKLPASHTQPSVREKHVDSQSEKVKNS